eukprot:CAMPEP_0117651104 /NCGR_PEP_ID=MMETSP0804-20121206/1911_1 /TAXON_ID=1074897 /ORGANISM="Tetraselmis astigmatica, Strain CCMP880" /LENGTH=330 /DNA_ID=CAMNT_0005457053 /DNA_START=195 /DNA_END=1189 /DNA_ORIENTATION=-
MKVAAAHVAPVYMNSMASAKKAAEWIARAGGEGVELVVFPEVFLPGFPYWINVYPPCTQAGLNRRYQDQSVEIGGPEIAVIREAAKAAGCAVTIGVSERQSGGRTCHNSAVVIDKDGSLVSVHRKLMPTYAERYIWGLGYRLPNGASDLGGARGGSGLLGAHHEPGEAEPRGAERGGALRAVAIPSTLVGFDTVANPQIEAMMKNHAITGQVPVVCASSPVTQEMLDFMEKELGPQTFMGTGGGWTAVVHPFALVLSGPVSSVVEEQLVVAEIDPSMRNDVKMWVDNESGGHYSRPDIFQFSFQSSGRTCSAEDLSAEHTGAPAILPPAP